MAVKISGLHKKLSVKWFFLTVIFFIGIQASQGWSKDINEKLSLDGELRLRYELMDGFNDTAYGETVSTGEGHDGYLLNRIRLGMTYKYNDDILLRVSMQDARAFDWDFDNSDWYTKEFGMGNNPQKDYFELYHTYLQVSNIKGLPLKLTIGRQRIAYGDNRVFGPGEWKNSGKWIWDAAKLSYSKGEHFVDIFYGGIMLHDPDKFSLTHRWGYEGIGIYGHYAWNQGAFEPILAYKHNDNGVESYDSRKHYYTGFRMYDDDVAGFFYDGTYIRQAGEQVSVSGLESDVEAYGWHLDAGYGFKIGEKKVRIGTGYTYASGDDSSTQDIERFDGVFGASDNFYGRMNLMIWSNLMDSELYVIISPLKNTKIKMEYHRYRIEDKTDKWRNYKNSAGVMEDHLGDEIDVVATYDHTKNIQIQAGYGHFWPGDFIKYNVPAENGADWLFFQTSFSF
jgi:hypothetical protein